MTIISFKKIDIKKIKKGVEFLTQRAFFAFFLLFFLGVIFGGILFLKYFILIQKAPLRIEKEPLKLERRIYDQVLKIWGERELKFEEAGNEALPNFFQGH